MSSQFSRSFAMLPPLAACSQVCGCQLMPVSELHRRVAAIALDAAAGYGFALGGNALLAHGIIRRPTWDVDLCEVHLEI